MSFKINDKPITVTMFPDKTSQVWKLPEELFLMQTINIEWTFEHEGEIMHLAQMVDLFRSKGPRVINLYLPYLPYARQDKPVNNQCTFALTSFARIVGNFEIDQITVLDAHSDKFKDFKYGYHEYGKKPDFEIKARLEFENPYERITQVFKETNAELYCFPDRGAKYRYNLDPAMYCNKERDWSTGEIKGIQIDDFFKRSIMNKRVLIVDDICDGGKTFIEVAKLLYANGATEVNLYVTHGIFSKGVKPLLDAGIKKVYTYNSQVTERNGHIITFEE